MAHGMIKLLLLPLLSSLALGAAAQDAVDEPLIIEHTLWVQKGRASQFSTLLERTELVRLEALIESGNVDWVRTTEPLLVQADEGWDLRVTIAWRNRVDAFGPQGFLKQPVDGPGASNRPIERDLLNDLIVDRQDAIIEESVRTKAR